MFPECSLSAQADPKFETVIALVFNFGMLLVYTWVHPSSTWISHSLKVTYTVLLNMNLFIGFNIQCEVFDEKSPLVTNFLLTTNLLGIGVCSIFLLNVP
jgi:hypothetical protein